MNNSTGDACLIVHNKKHVWLKVAFGLYVSTLILGFSGNFSVKKTRTRRPHELFILNPAVAVCDLILIMVFLHFQIYIFMIKFSPSVFYCKLVAPLTLVALSVFTQIVKVAHHQPIQANHNTTYS